MLAELHSKVLDTLFHSGEFDELLNADENRRAVRDVIRDACTGHRAIAHGIADGETDRCRDGGRSTTSTTSRTR